MVPRRSFGQSRLLDVGGREVVAGWQGTAATRGSGTAEAKLSRPGPSTTSAAPAGLNNLRNCDYCEKLTVATLAEGLASR